MTQSPKPKKPRPKEKLSDREQSERFIDAAQQLEKVATADFNQSLSAILGAKNQRDGSRYG
jgi:hypothetical protein